MLVEIDGRKFDTDNVKITCDVRDGIILEITEDYITAYNEDGNPSDGNVVPIKELVDEE